KLAILRLVVDGEGRGAQLVREAPVAGRAAVRGARVEDGVAASDVPDRRRESWFGGEPFVGRQRRDGAQRDRRVARAGEAKVQVSVPLEHGDAVSGSVAADQDGRSVGQLCLRQLERAPAITSDGPG